MNITCGNQTITPILILMDTTMAIKEQATPPSNILMAWRLLVLGYGTVDMKITKGFGRDLGLLEHQVIRPMVLTGLLAISATFQTVL